MEVTVLEVSNPPTKPVLAIHAGVVRRQARLEVNQPFVIPHPGTQTGPVEVSLFQQLASQVLPNDNKPEVLCSIPVKRHGGESSQVQLRVRRGEAALSTDDKMAEAKDSVGLTRDYLEQHQLQQRIQSLIQDVLREQPDNPYKYMVELLRKNQGSSTSQPSKDPSPAAPKSATQEAKAPLTPKAPDKPKPDGPRGRSTNLKTPEADKSDKGSTRLQTDNQPRPHPRELGEARAAANFSVVQILRGGACRQAAEHSLRAMARRLMSESLSVLVLNSVKEKLVSEASVSVSSRTIARASMNMVFNRSAVMLSPEYSRALTAWAVHLAYRGACSLLGYSSRRASRVDSGSRRNSMPTPIVFLESDRAGWGNWLKS